jgi:hypothetical protein
LDYSRKGVQENDGGVKSKMIYCRNFVNVTMYLQYNNNKIIRMFLKSQKIN